MLHYLLTSYENEFLDNMIKSGHRRLARSFNLCYRYIDDFIVFNNKKFLDYLKEIYPSQLTVEKANKSDHQADYLDLTFIIDSGGKLSTRLYDKRDNFDFNIVNFPFLSSNIPSGPSCLFPAKILVRLLVFLEWKLTATNHSKAHQVFTCFRIDPSIGRFLWRRSLSLGK